MEVIGQAYECDWLKVIIPQGTQGWVAGGPKYVIRNLSCDLIPAAPIPPTPTPVPILTSQEAERVEQLIAQLRSPSEDVCKEASVQLSAMGEKLSEEHVLEIAQIMRTSSARWQTGSRRGQHCTYYDYITTKYYAADSLLKMRSIYVSNEIATEARTARVEGKYTRRVDDPGWI